jgi:hypothetical protein
LIVVADLRAASEETVRRRGRAKNAGIIEMRSNPYGSYILRLHRRSKTRLLKKLAQVVHRLLTFGDGISARFNC